MFLCLLKEGFYLMKVVSKRSRSKPKFKGSFQNRSNILGTAKVLNFRRLKWRVLQGHEKSLKGVSRISANFGLQWRANKAFRYQYFLKRSSIWNNAVLFAFKHFKTSGGCLMVGSFLECRLDVVLWRMRFASSVLEGGVLVNHGHIFVNGHKCRVRSFLLSSGDFIEVRFFKCQLDVFISRVCHSNFYTTAFLGSFVCIDNRRLSISSYLEVSFASMCGVFVTVPRYSVIKYDFSLDLRRALEMH